MVVLSDYLINYDDFFVNSLGCLFLFIYILNINLKYKWKFYVI